MDLGLTGRVALVAGASKGLGNAIALGLAREGAHVALCARSDEKLIETAKFIEKNYRVAALPIAADLRNSQDIDRVVDSTIEKFDRGDGAPKRREHGRCEAGKLPRNSLGTIWSA